VPAQADVRGQGDDAVTGRPVAVGPPDRQLETSVAQPDRPDADRTAVARQRDDIAGADVARQDLIGLHTREFNHGRP
jgi:hypothetical protein